jgi:hypothetical protein
MGLAQMGDDLPQHWPSEIEIDESWDTPEAFEGIVKFHSIPALTKYIRSCSFLCAPDIDGWRMKNLLQRIFLSSDPDNEDLKVLVSIACIYHGEKGNSYQNLLRNTLGLI